jgi:hypothetical protein
VQAREDALPSESEDASSRAHVDRDFVRRSPRLPFGDRDRSCFTTDAISRTKRKRKKGTRGESTASQEKEIAQSSEERCCGLSIIVTITIIFLIIMRIIINDNYR